MKFYITKPGMAIFIDRSNKDREVARRKYGWFPAWTQVDCKPLFDIDTRYTLIGVVDCFGFVIPACETDLHKWKEKDEHKHLNIRAICSLDPSPYFG